MATDKRPASPRPTRDYPSLFMKLCSCGGTQPSLTDPKIEGHEHWCRYRIEVERDGNSGD